MKTILRVTAISILFLTLLNGTTLFASGQRDTGMKLTIDGGIRYQNIEHFGASAAWWAQVVGTWPEKVQSDLLDLLFDPVKGIGLSVIRYNIGGGKSESGIQDPWRSAASPLDSQGKLDWSRDRAAVGIVDGAVRRGASVILFSNSPPAAMTVTGAPTGNRAETNLRADMRKNFANFLADCIDSLSKERHWPIIAVSPANEPQWDWQPSKGQEGSFYTADDLHGLLLAVSQVFDDRGVRVPISTIDSGEWKLSSNIKFLNAIWADPVLAKRLSHYAVHSYWSDAEDKANFRAYADANFPGLKIWQSEWTEMKGGRDYGMDSALVLAKTVHDDLTVGGVTSWQYWIAVSKYDFRDGLLYADEAKQNFETTKRLYALGNWSRFVKPGAQRIGISYEAGDELMPSAFANADGTVVCVVVNSGESDSPRTDPGLGRPAKTMEIWETSEKRSLERVYEGAVRAVTFPARSVTTLVFRP